MFRRSFLVCFALGVLLSRSNGQALTMDSYANQLLFNIFKDSPDTAIRPFLRSYTPSLLDKKTGDAVISAGEKKERNNFEIHSFVFTRHPYFTPIFASGKMEFFCEHFSDAKGVQVYDVRLWFDFDTQEDAELAFSKLVEMFMPIATKQRFSSPNGSRKAEFSDTKSPKGFNKIQFRLTADNLDHHKFKILFETLNDL